MLKQKQKSEEKNTDPKIFTAKQNHQNNKNKNKNKHKYKNKNKHENKNEHKIKNKNKHQTGGFAVLEKKTALSLNSSVRDMSQGETKSRSGMTA